MYCEHFGLRCLPFEERADARFYLKTADAEETLASMEYAAHYGQGVAAVVGPAGSGKTLLIRALLSRLSRTDHVAVLTIPAGGRIALIREVAKHFGIALGSSRQSGRLLERFRRYLARLAKSEQRALLIIDQAHELTAETLTEVSALYELRVDGGQPLQIILVGESQLLDRLQDPRFARLQQGAFGARALKPLSLEETVAYIKHRLRVAGASRPGLVEPDAVELVYQHSGGNPQRINQICNAALVAAYGAHAFRIDGAVIREVTGTAPAGPATTETAPQTPPVEAETAAPPSTVVAESSAEPPPSQQVFAEHEVFEEPETQTDKLELPVARLITDEQVARLLGDALAQVDLSGLTDRYVQRAQERLQGLWKRHDEQWAAFEARLTRAEQVWDESAQQLDRVQRECRRAEELRTRLASFAGELAGRVEETQQKIALLMGSLQAGDAAYERLEQIAHQVADLSTAAETDVNTQRARLRGAIEDADRAHARLPEGVIEQLERRSAELTRQFQAQVAELTEHIPATLNAQREELAQAVQAASRARDEIINTTTETCRRRLEEVREQVVAQQRGTEETLAATAHEVARVQEQVTTLAERARTSASVVSTMSSQVDEATTTARRLAADAQQARTIAEELTGRARPVLAELTGLTSRGEALLQDVRETEMRLMATHETTRENLVRAEEACRRTGDLQRQAADAERLGTQLTAARDTATQTMLALQEQVGSVHQVREAIGADLVAAQDQHDRLLAAQRVVGPTLTQLREVAAAAEKLTERLERAHRQADQQLSATDQQMQRVAALRDESRAASHTLADQTQQLRSLLQEVEAQTGATRESLSQMQASRGEADGTAARLHEVTAAAERTRAEVHRAMQQAEAQFARSAAQAAEATTGAEARLQDVASQAAAAVQQMNKAADQVIAQTEHRAAAIHQRLTEALQQVSHQAGQVAEGTGARLTTLSTELAGQVQRMHDEAQRTLTDAERRIGQIDTKVTEAIRQVHGQADRAVLGADTRLCDIADNVTHALERLTEASTQAEAHGQRLQALTGQAEALQPRLEEAVAVARVQDSAARKTQSELADGVHVARQVQETIQRGVLEANDKIGKLDSHHAAATSLVHRLHDASCETHQLLENVDTRQGALQQEVVRAVACTRDVRAAIAQTEPALEHLRSRHEELTGTLEQLEPATQRTRQTLADLTLRNADAQATREQLDQTAQTAGRLLTELERSNDQCTAALDLSGGYRNEIIALSATAAEHLTNLREMTARAQTQLDKLTTAQETVQSTLTRGEDLHQDTRALEAQLGERSQQIMATVEAAVRDAHQLAADTGHVQQLLEQLATGEQPARALLAALQEALDEAEVQGRTLQEGCAQAAGVARQVVGVTTALEAARTAGDRIHELIEQANTLEPTLRDEVGRAGAQCSALQTLRQETDAVHATHEELLGDLTTRCAHLEQQQQQAGQTLERLAQLLEEGVQLQDRLRTQQETIRETLEHPDPILREISHHAGALQSGQQMLRDFVSRQQSLTEDIQMLHDRVEQIKLAVVQAITRPAEVAQKAQEQAVHLERVCGAVRKVFSGLAQAALHSNRQTEQFRQTSAEAMAQLTRLKAETEQASVTLNEWVEEARRVQTRLERTLTAAPSLAQTHATDSLYRLSRLVPGTARERSVDDELTALTPQRGRLSEAETATPAAARSRVDEITALLEDAQAAAPLGRS
ncbi:MAG TPA: AAA family ATPase [Phycisphaerae bacterium]|nr:AAA family ATPase [Phycisphaerae bacterium]HNU46941.1 AAA family ATPase [Phycisphaerae bacterium]